MLCIDSQSVKSVPFVNKDKGIDGNKLVNGRKRHLIVDTLGLVWGVVVHAADIPDGVKAYLFLDWVKDTIIGLEVEFASKPPTKKGFVPIMWRWVNERTFGWLNFFRRHSKDFERTVESAEAWILWANCQIILNRLG